MATAEQRLRGITQFSISTIIWWIRHTSPANT